MTIFAVKDFDIETVLKKPLMAHLSTTSLGEPRDSPVWFIWEESSLWVFGTDKDSFIQRLEKEPRCAAGIVDFDVDNGLLLHVGMRGTAQVGNVDSERLIRFVSKYLGNDHSKWNEWFVTHIVDPLNVMVQIIPESIAARDGSYFKTGQRKGNEGN